MTTQDDFRWAAAAWRETLRKCTLSLAAQLERKGRAHMSLPAMRVEGREQIELAKKLREQARRAGL